MKTRRILHLLDDVMPGALTRTLAHLETVAPHVHEVQTLAFGDRLSATSGHDVIVSHLSAEWLTPRAAAELRAAVPHLPLVHVEHALAPGHPAVSRGPHGIEALREVYKRFDRVIACSEAQAAWLLAERLVPDGRIGVIPPASDLSGFAALPPAVRPARRFGVLGRLTRQKGVDIAIAAFRKLENPGLTLDIIGAGPMRDALVEQAAGDPRIRFHGHAVDPVQAMRGLDAVLAPSRWEAYGLSTLEARAAGRIAIASGAGGLRDQVCAGARHVPGLTARAWTAAISRAATEPAPEFEIARARVEADRAMDRFETRWALTLDSLARHAPAPAKRAARPAPRLRPARPTLTLVAALG
ncbi:glycosyltransferase family 4 protein [Rhodovulum sp. DZ06]|uniref:glycosyltransferase family 4 protein n=1 Tax=Rhodovulum sp. DZ06 TaxID=3425126 RepID=UPI003D35878E